MEYPSLFPDISPIEELLDIYFSQDEQSNLSCIQNHQLEETTGERGDTESFPDGSQPHLSSEVYSSSTSPQRQAEVQKSIENITEEDLANLPIRELNKRLRNLRSDEAQKIRKRRRSLKNREYATSARRKRSAIKMSLTTQNQRLSAQLRQTKEILSETVKERDSYKNKYENLKKVYAALSTTSPMMQSRNTNSLS